MIRNAIIKQLADKNNGDHHRLRDLRSNDYLIFDPDSDGELILSVLDSFETERVKKVKQVFAQCSLRPRQSSVFVV